MSEPSEIFHKLECNDTEIIENARIEIYNLFKTVKDAWVVNGLYDYYLISNSLRSMEILANVNEVHYKYLFDRLTESIRRQETEMKVKALTLLGHIVRKQPTWIYKIYDHTILREILSLLKGEDDILPLVSALLLVIVLMPMIPSLIAHHLQDIFDIFSRLAAWNMGAGPQLEKPMMIHMQISLYALFLRLYGMYPCNFVAYIRSYYRDKNNPVFMHTIQPMLETVRMHPRLVTATKDNELSAERWKTVGSQQVIAECEQFYVDVMDKCPHDCCYVSTGFRSRSNTTTSSAAENPKFQLEKLKEFCELPPRENIPVFSPSFAFSSSSSAPTDIVTTSRFVHISSSHEGTSPPEAAIEATPETTPVRDSMRNPVVRVPHIGSSVVRGLTSFTSKNKSANTTPTHSQPSSPMRKDGSPFHFPNVGRESNTNQRLQKMLLERSQSVDVYVEQTTIPGVSPLIIPSSPVKIMNNSESNNRALLEASTSTSTLSDDEKIKSIIAQRENANANQRDNIDNVTQEFAASDGEELDNTLEQGSPCSQGGLHLPNSKSMNEFAIRVQRLRYHSQNNDIDQPGESTGSSPGRDSSKQVEASTVRRANSCPDMKKKKSPISVKKPLKVTNEEVDDGSDGFVATTTESETQTEDGYMPYEHLFLNIFPCLSSNEVKPSPTPNPVPVKPFGEKENHHSVYNVLDRYIEISKGDVSNPGVQIQLLQHQLLFERYRRETFSARNRKLLADGKNAKALEEYNSALKDTIWMQQKEIDRWNEQFELINLKHFEEQKKMKNYIQLLEKKYKSLQDQVLGLESEKDKQAHNFNELLEKYRTMDNERQQASSALFEAYAQLNIAKEQAAIGEKARSEVERLNKEILLLGELQLKYQEKSADLIRQNLADVQHKMAETGYKKELKVLKSKLETSKSLVDAYRQRITDLEVVVTQKDEGISQLKKNLMETNVENNEKIKAVESRYKSQLAINRALEQKIFQLYTRLDFPGIRNLHSPETSSCHEAMATPSVSAHSPHSSPLSVSLASSGSGTAFLNSDIKEMKNLQVLVEKKTSKLDDSVESAGDTIEMLQQDQLPSTSNTAYQND